MCRETGLKCPKKPPYHSLSFFSSPMLTYAYDYSRYRRNLQAETTAFDTPQIIGFQFLVLADSRKMATSPNEARSPRFISHPALEFIGLHHKSACNFEKCRYNNSRCVWKAPTKGGPGKNTSLAPSLSACTLAGCTCEDSMRVVKVDRSNLVFQRKTNYYIDSENDRIIG